MLAPAGYAVRAIVHLRYAAPRGYPSPSRRAFTAPDGSFWFQRLDAGQYVLCTQIPQFEAPRSAAPFLDTCDWDPALSPIT